MLSLDQTLKQQFTAERAAEFDFAVEINCPTKTYRMDINLGKATFYDAAEHAPAPELILYFRDEQSAADILSGRCNPLDAFMQGDFRSNGYLFWAFQTIAIFALPQAGS